MATLRTSSLLGLLIGGVLALGAVAAPAGADTAADDPVGVLGAAATTTTSVPSPSAASTIPGAPGVGSTAVTGSFEVTLLTVEDPVAGNELFPPEEGNRFIGVELEMRNTSAEVQAFSSLLSVEVVDAEGQSWSPSLFAVSDRSTLDGDIPAGESRRGWIGFEVPVVSTGLRLFVAGDVFGGGTPATFALDADRTSTIDSCGGADNDHGVTSTDITATRLPLAQWASRSTRRSSERWSPTSGPLRRSAVRTS